MDSKECLEVLTPVPPPSAPSSEAYVGPVPDFVLSAVGGRSYAYWGHLRHRAQQHLDRQAKSVAASTCLLGRDMETLGTACWG